jgi:cobalamin synthase
LEIPSLFAHFEEVTPIISFNAGWGGAMDALTASLIVAVIGATASVVVAVVTARARIGMLPATVVRDPSSPFHARELPESAKKSRVLGWILVLLLFLAATFCLLQGLNALRIFFHWDQWEAIFGSQLSGRAEIELYSRFWIAIAVVLAFLGFWAQRRLRRHAK